MKTLFVLASAGGSELPWWTPLAVSLALLVAGALYRFFHRRRGSGGDATLITPEGAEPAAGPGVPQETDPPTPGPHRGALGVIPAHP